MIRKFYNRSTSQLQQQAQKDVLDYFCKSSVTSKKVSLPSGALNYIDILSPTVSSSGAAKSTLVLTHGYGSGLGFFYANYDALIRQYDRVIALDWLGMGSSSRDANIAKPKMRYVCGTSASSWCSGPAMTPSKAADFFIDSLEELRVELDLASFVLAGHSLGGYLSGRYAHKYPAQLQGLVMISPVGVPAWPDSEALVPSGSMSLGYQLLHTAWKGNLTPQSLIRIAGATKGEKTVRSILQRRFGKNKFDDKQVELLSRYLYQITAAKPCGEFAMNSLLTPLVSSQPAAGRVPVGSGGGKNENGWSTSVYAHEPLEKLFTTDGGLKIPSVLVMYGDHDWLHYPQIEQCLRSWERESGVSASYAHISSAGHHIYLDNPEHFHQVMARYKNSVYK